MRLIGNVEKDAQVRAVASGALPSGDAVIVNSDGTVSVVEETSISQAVGSSTVFEGTVSTSRIATAFDANAQKIVIAYRGTSGYGYAVVGTVSGTSISFGTPVVYESGTVDYQSICYDESAQKMVIAYRDASNSGYGTAIVGTVSGTSISFGSAVVFEFGSTLYTAITYESNAQKVVIAYHDQSNSLYGTAIVGTVSGTSISFGSAVVFESADSTYISIAYDANAQKVVIAYRDEGNSNYGTAIVGTVSGTSISFGSAVVFESATSIYTSVVYDESAQKVVIAYQDFSNSSRGTAIVGTVSGTSISFGSAVVFESGSSRDFSAVYHALSQQVVVTYRDVDNSSYGTAIVGTVSGTSISFGSSVALNSSSTFGPVSAYDSNAGTVVIAYYDGGNSNYGTSVVFQPAYSSTNLTSENFLGFAAHTYADGQSALVNSTCTVDRNQSGLTAGQTYYVQTDGSLSTEAGNPSVVAGTAISSTEIIVKG